MERQSLFSGKNNKKYFKMVSAELFSQHAKQYSSRPIHEIQNSTENNILILVSN